MTAARGVSPQWAARLVWVLWLLAMLGLAVVTRGPYRWVRHPS